MEIYFFNSTHPDSSVIAQPEFLSFSKSMGTQEIFLILIQLVSVSICFGWEEFLRIIFSRKIAPSNSQIVFLYLQKEEN